MAGRAGRGGLFTCVHLIRSPSRERIPRAGSVQRIAVGFQGGAFQPGTSGPKGCSPPGAAAVNMLGHGGFATTEPNLSFYRRNSNSETGESRLEGAVLASSWRTCKSSQWKNVRCGEEARLRGVWFNPRPACAGKDAGNPVHLLLPHTPWQVDKTLRGHFDQRLGEKEEDRKPRRPVHVPEPGAASARLQVS